MTSFFWCAILSDYRTDFYDGYKLLEYKIGLLSDYDEYLHIA